MSWEAGLVYTTQLAAGPLNKISRTVVANYSMPEMFCINLSNTALLQCLHQVFSCRLLIPCVINVLMLMLALAMRAGQRERSDWGATGLTHLPARPDLMQSLPLQGRVLSGGKMERS